MIRLTFESEITSLKKEIELEKDSKIEAVSAKLD